MPPVKCPTPSCAFRFDPAKVPAGAVLECPRCRARFRLDPPAPTLAPTPAPAIPTPRGHGVTSYIVPVLGVMVLVVGLLIAVFLWGKQRPPAAVNVIRSDILNFSFAPPGGAWENDEETKTNRLGVNVAAFRRTDPDAWVAVAAKDFGDLQPRRIELDAFVDDHLRRMFDNLNLEDKPGATWVGLAATRFEFRATAKGTDAVYVGEVYALPHKGVAYWFFAWASLGAITKVHSEFDPIRERLSFLQSRDGWKESVPKLNVITGSAGYTLTDVEGIWAKPAMTEPRDEDPKADLLAEAIDPVKGIPVDARPKARLVAFLLPPGNDPLTTARKYVIARYNRDPETFGPAVIEDLTDEPRGEPSPGGGGGKTPVARLRLTRPNSPSSAKLIVIAGVEIGGQIAALELSCPLEQRGVWEQRLIALATTLSNGK